MAIAGLVSLTVLNLAHNDFKVCVCVCMHVYVRMYVCAHL
jgi:hypothetical protein